MRHRVATDLSVVVVVVVQLKQLILPALLQRLEAAGGVELEALRQDTRQEALVRE
jgi:hypothetical protein